MDDSCPLKGTGLNFNAFPSTMHQMPSEDPDREMKVQFLMCGAKDARPMLQHMLDLPYMGGYHDMMHADHPQPSGMPAGVACSYRESIAYR